MERDATVQYPIMELFDNYGAQVVVDSAFSLSQKDFMIKSTQQDPLPGGNHGTKVNEVATSV